MSHVKVATTSAFFKLRKLPEVKVHMALSPLQFTSKVLKASALFLHCRLVSMQQTDIEQVNLSLNTCA